MTDYLPKHATIEQACAWLQARTGETWVLPRLLEHGLTPWFWLDYTPGWPAIFGDRVEGYLAPMVFASDTQRLEADGTDALVNITRAHDGTIYKPSPGIRVPLSGLRFKREAVERVADIVSAKPAPVVEADPTPWHLLATPADLIAAFGASTGMNKSWFANAKDTPQLLDARHIAGQGGRNGREPFYFVFPAMQWLTDAKRRKGKSITEATGWRILKNKFPKVYEQYQEYEPEPD